MKNNKHYIHWGITAFVVILAGLISYYIIFHLENFKDGVDRLWVILMPITDGLVIAYLLTPLLNVIEGRIVKPCLHFFHWKPKKKQLRMVSIVVTLVLVCAIIYGFFALVIPQIVNSIVSIVYQFPNYVDRITVLISQLLENNPDIESFVTETISKYSSDLESLINQKLLPQLNNIIQTISTSVVSILKQFWNLIIGFIISVYVLAGKENFAAQFKKMAYAFLPMPSANRLISNVRFASKTFCGFFVGKILDSIIIGIICFVCTSFIGTPFNVLISVIIGVTNIIPFFGPFLGAIPSIILILLIDPLQALYFLIFVFILQQADGNIIGPKILGSSTGLSSFWVIFSITLFGGLFGIAGMILGVPIFAVIFAFIKSMVESRLALREMPTETSKYLKLLYIDADTKEFAEFSEDDRKPFSEISKILVKSQERLKQQDFDIRNFYKKLSRDDVDTQGNNVNSDDNANKDAKAMESTSKDSDSKD